jgi:stress response protein YsnF
MNGRHERVGLLRRRSGERHTALTDPKCKKLRQPAGQIDEMQPDRGGEIVWKARAPVPVMPFTNLFLWPWSGLLQGSEQGRPPSSSTAKTSAGLQEVIPLGEEVLEVTKRTENRGTARIRRYVVETSVEQQVTLASERVIVERRRPAQDKVTGEVLTNLTVEMDETAEVPVIGKRLRLREEIVIRTERTEHVETVQETIRRDEVEIQQPGKKHPARERPNS